MEEDLDGYRQLVAAILQRAVDDCALEQAGFAIPAWRWIKENHPWFLKYCDHLDIDPGHFRSRCLALFGRRCERLWRNQHEGRRETVPVIKHLDRSRTPRQEGEWTPTFIVMSSPDDNPDP